MEEEEQEEEVFLRASVLGKCRSLKGYRSHIIRYLVMQLVMHFKKSENRIQSVNRALLSVCAANFSLGCAPREFHT